MRSINLSVFVKNGLKVMCLSPLGWLQSKYEMIQVKIIVYDIGQMLLGELFFGACLVKSVNMYFRTT